MEFNIIRRIYTPGPRYKLALYLAIGLLLSITALLFHQIRTLERSSAMVSHSIRVDKEINTLFSQFDLMESAEFRAVILQDSTLGESYLDRKLASDRTFEGLKYLIQDMPRHQVYLDSIAILKDELHSTLTGMHRRIKPVMADLTTMLYVERAASILRELRAIRTAMLLHNTEQLQQHMAVHRRYTIMTPVTSLFLAVFSIAVFSIAYVRLRRQKNRIQSSELLLQNIVQSTDNIMNYYEPIRDPAGEVVDFRVVFANSCNKEYLDLDPDDILGKPVSQAFPFLLKNNELQRMVDCFHKGGTIDFERQVEVKGVRYWFHTFIKAMDRGILEVVRNNTEENSAKEDLLHLNERLEIHNFIMTEAKKMAKIGSYVSFFKTDKAEISDNFYRILDCEPGEFEPTFEEYRKFVHPEDLGEFDTFGQWLKEVQNPREHIYRVITKKGRIKYLRTKGRYIQRHGRTVMMGIVQDVSDRIQAEDDLKIKNLELERINVELESFNRVASHDLQEPLRKIQMFISRMDDTEESRLSEKGREYLEKIHRVAARMQSLIRNLLAYAQIGGKGDEFERVDLNEVLKKVQEDCSEQLKETQAQLELEGLPTVRGIPFQLEQLFSNLLLNALKYRKPGIVPIIGLKSEKVSHKQIPGQFTKLSKHYHMISLSDNGIGFDPEGSGMIFELFHRLHSGVNHSGTGIGLAICKKIVENHHGMIRAQGQLGEGAVFIIYLPEWANLADS